MCRYIINYKVEYHKIGSILIVENNLSDINFYLPLRGKSINTGNYYSKEEHSYLIENALSFLGKSEKFDNYNDEFDELYYLVLEDIIIFTTEKVMGLGNYDFDVNEIENDYIGILFDDIKDEINNFDNLGISSNNINCLIEEHWSQSMDDWDCYTEYLGTINLKFNTDDIISKKSQERRKNSKDNDNNEYSDISEWLEKY
tara:strand:- start:30520 stop:31119 length:600 start_codon:yes stop_codon:yes gene_type:complete